MKRRFLLLLLAVGFVALSCRRTELVDGPRSAAVLEFSPSVAGSPGAAPGSAFGSAVGSAVASKAVTDMLFDTYGFSIAGYHTQGTMSAALVVDPSLVYPNVFDYSPADGQSSVPLVKKNGDNKYILRTVKWLLDDQSYLSYYAWAQNKVKDDVSGVVGEYASRTKYGAPVLSIKNADLATAQVDIVAARYEDQLNDVVVSAVDLNFAHILAKLTFNLKSSVGADVSLSKVDLAYGADAVHSSATYELMGDKMVDLQGFHTGSNAYGAKTISRGAAVVAGELLLLPQAVKKGFVNFTLTYTITTGSGLIAQTKVVDLPAGTLVGGVNHSYTIDITAEGIEVSNPLVIDWISDPVDRLPLVSGPRGDVMLLLDGYEPPYQHSDGKWYWLDKSGYNRHCEIVTFDANTYSAANKCYNFGQGQSFKLADMGAFTDLTVDLCSSRSSTNTGTTPFVFHKADGTTPVFQVYTGYSSDATVRILTKNHTSAGQGALNHTFAGGAAAVRAKSFWTFVSAESPNQVQLYHNASLLATQSMALTNRLEGMAGGVLGSDFNGSVHYFKVTKKAANATDVLKSFKENQAKLAISSDTKFDPPVRDAAILWFDGYTGPQRTAGTDEFYWEDRSADQNNGIIVGDVVWNGSGYRVTNGYILANGWKAKHGNVDFTVEMLYLLHSKPWRTWFFSGYTRRQASDIFNYRTVSITDDNSSTLTFMSAFDAGSSDVLLSKRVANIVKKPSVLQASRRVGSQTLHLDGELLAAGVPIRVLEAPTVITFGSFVGAIVPDGQFNGELKAIVLHKRVLTDAELKQNHEFYKAYYNID